VINAIPDTANANALIGTSAERIRYNPSLVPRLIFILVFVLAGSVRLALAQPVLVQGAMPVEVDKLVKRLEHASSEQVGGWTFWRGTIDGYTVIISKTLKGAANAAAATAIAIERYHPVAIINQGTSGGHEPSLKLYDIVLGTSAVSLSAFRAPHREAGSGSNPLAWRPLNLIATEGSASQGPTSVARFDGDPMLLEVARGATKSYARGRVVDGVIGTSDMWIDEIDLIARYHGDFGTSVEEMETASAAQVARAFRVPFLGIRVVSDNITNGTPYNVQTAEACEDFVFDVLKAFIARQTPAATPTLALPR
jgi:adenosylhomocysteine nucleosidase